MRRWITWVMEDAASLMGEFVPELVRHAQVLDNSPITGPEGNIEFMCDMVPGAEGSLEVGALPEQVARMPRLTGAGDGGRGGGGQSYTQKMARAECPGPCRMRAERVAQRRAYGSRHGDASVRSGPGLWKTRACASGNTHKLRARGVV